MIKNNLFIVLSSGASSFKFVADNTNKLSSYYFEFRYTDMKVFEDVRDLLTERRIAYTATSSFFDGVVDLRIGLSTLIFFICLESGFPRHLQKIVRKKLTTYNFE